MLMKETFVIEVLVIITIHQLITKIWYFLAVQQCMIHPNYYRHLVKMIV